MLNGENQDELKALLALGIIAAIGIIFQLEVTHVSVAHWRTASPLMKLTLQYWKFSILAVFSVYVALLSLALGVNDMRGGGRVADWLKWWADFFFGLGSLLLASAIVVYALRVVFD